MRKVKRQHVSVGCAVTLALFVLGVCLAGSGGPNRSTVAGNPTPSPSCDSFTDPSCGASPTPSTSTAAVTTPKPVVDACVQPDAANSHVYSPDRLKVLKPCITATGTIDFIRHEADGDFHVGLKLDPAFAGLVNSCNSTCLQGAEHGDLVVEPVCMTTPTQADAVSSCVGYHNPLVIPPASSHVSMTGAYVLDLDHGWTEIHPLTEVHVI